jgi:hypothetical protein
MAEIKEKNVKIKGVYQKISLIPTVVLNVENFLNECATNKEEAKGVVQTLSKLYEKKRKTTIEFNQFGERYVDRITIWGNAEYFVGDITFDYREFAIKIQRLLGIDQIVDINSPEFTKLLEDKVEKLSQINTLDELHEKFPELYMVYIEGNSMYNYAEAVLNNKPNNPSDAIKRQIVEAEYKSNYYYSCGLRRNVKQYVENQVVMLNHVIKHVNDLVKKANDFSIGNNLSRKLDKEKTKMYIVMKMLDECKECRDPEKLDVYLKTLKRYFSGSERKEIIHDEHGNPVTYNELLIRYNNMIKKGDFTIDWIIMPRGKEESSSQGGQTGRRTNTEIDPRLIEFNERKKRFYDNIQCLGRAKGISNNKGYTAFFMPNSQILLDRIAYSEDEIRSAYGNAIYNMNTGNFEQLSALSKKTLRQEHLCPIYPHSGDWEIPVTAEVVNQVATEGTVNRTRLLIRKLEGKK